MKKHPILTPFLSLALCFLLLVSSLMAAEITPVWSTRVALPGEPVTLYIVSPQGRTTPFEIEKYPVAKNASIELENFRNITPYTNPRQEPLLVLPIIVTPSSSGEVKIDNISLTNSKTGEKISLAIPPLRVLPFSSIKWYENPIPYGALWYIEKDDPYVNESVKVHLKILLPRGVSLEGIPPIQAEGLLSTPFNLSLRGDMSQFQQSAINRAVVKSRDNFWQAYDLQSLVTPTRSGKSSATGKIGVAWSRSPLTIQREELPIPALTLNAFPLPLGAPASFENEVGDYSITATSDAKYLAINEPIDVSIRISGTGNLQAVPCPQLSTPDDWKVLPAKMELETDVSGQVTAVTYNQMIRPIREVGAIPSFAMSYFSPSKQEYATTQSSPIPLPWQQNEETGSGLVTGLSEAPPAGTVPVAEMVDIYGFLPAEIDGQISFKSLPTWSYYLFYAPCVIILLYLFICWMIRKRAASADTRATEKELRRLGGLQNNLDFLRQTAAFIESHIPRDKQDDTLRQSIKRRDEETFRPDAKPDISDAEKKDILSHIGRVLKQVSKSSLLLLLTLLLLPQLKANSASDYDEQAEQLYKKGEYSASVAELQKGIALLDKAPEAQGNSSKARLYYHLGNSYYRLGQPGKAAHAYALSLKENPSLNEAQANISFIQRKQGALLADNKTQDDIFTYFSAQSLCLLSVIATAVLLTCIALLLLIKSRPQYSIKTILVLSIILTLACSANWIYYYTKEVPHASMLEPKEIAYIINATNARSAADEEGSSLIRLPASTPVRIIAKRPTWSYVECENGVRGWIENKDYLTLAEES